MDKRSTSSRDAQAQRMAMKRQREGQLKPSMRERSSPFLASAGCTITTRGKQHDPENKSGSVFGRDNNRSQFAVDSHKSARFT